MIDYLSVFNGAAWISLPFVSGPLETFLLKLIYCVIILIMGFILSRIARRLIKKLIMPISIKDDHIISEKRAKTIRSVLENVAVFAIYFIAVYIVMIQVSDGLKTVVGAVAAAATVSFGLGAQNLISDFIAGFFIIFENQFSVGDRVEIQSKVGIVENIGLRSTRIRGLMGELFIIPNGSLGLVTNFEKERIFAIVNILIPYEENIDRVLEILQDELSRVEAGQWNGLGDTPILLGVSDFTESSVQITIAAVVVTEPDAVVRVRLGIERQIRLIVKRRFEKEGVRPPAHRINRTDGGK